MDVNYVKINISTSSENGRQTRSEINMFTDRVTAFIAQEAQKILSNSSIKIEIEEHCDKHIRCVKKG